MIKINSLKRTYGDFIAVNDVSFSIKRKEIVGLLGHNGAGKTTMMKMLSGYLEPCAGDIEINQLDMNSQRPAIQKRLGYLPETLPVYPEMSVADYLDYAATLKGFSGDEAIHEIRQAIKATDISAKLLAPIATLSRGYKQRVGVAQAILGKPELLILDEPTNGLDPTQTQHMRELIRKLAKDATVILSTHIMQEVDALCDHVLIMSSGQLVVDASLEELRSSHRLSLVSDLPPSHSSQLLEAKIEGIESLHAEAHGDHFRYQIELNHDSEINSASNAIAQNLIKQDFSLYALQQEQRDLESLFREISQPNSRQEVTHAA